MSRSWMERSREFFVCIATLGAHWRCTLTDGLDPNRTLAWCHRRSAIHPHTQEHRRRTLRYYRPFNILPPVDDPLRAHCRPRCVIGPVLIDHNLWIFYCRYSTDLISGNSSWTTSQTLNTSFGGTASLPSPRHPDKGFERRLLRLGAI
jgi:hypothetical protein